MLNSAHISTIYDVVSARRKPSGDEKLSIWVHNSMNDIRVKYILDRECPKAKRESVHANVEAVVTASAEFMSTHTDMNAEKSKAIILDAYKVVSFDDIEFKSSEITDYAERRLIDFM